MLDPESWHRIASYALGECSAVEALETRAWIDEDPERKALAEEVMRLVDVGPAAIWNVQEGWQRFSTSVGAEPVAREVDRRPAPRPLFARASGSVGGWRVGAAAAAILILAASSAVVWRLTHAGDQAVATPAPLRAVTTKGGQTAEVYLSDGTHVALGAASTLRFPATFAATRDVYLEGEAYFDVVRDPRREFSVHTARAVARDIGTKFSVRTYPNGSGTEVVVAEGAVALTATHRTSAPAATDSLVLTKADLGRVDDSGGLTMVRKVNVANYLAWMNGRLVFANTPLRDALPQLSRWFDVELTLGDPTLADARLTASLRVEALPEALTLLSAALDARIEHRGRTVVLYPNHRAR